MLRCETLQEPYWHSPIANITDSPPSFGLLFCETIQSHRNHNCYYSKECYTQHWYYPIFADLISQYRKAFFAITTDHHSKQLLKPHSTGFRSQFTKKRRGRLWGKNNQRYPIAPVHIITPSPADEWVRMISEPTDLNRVIPNLRLSHRAWYYRIGWNCVLWASLGWRW